MIKRLLVAVALGFAIYLGWNLRANETPDGRIIQPDMSGARKLSVQAMAPIEMDLPVSATTGTVAATVNCEEERRVLFANSVDQLVDMIARRALTLRSECTPPVIGLDTGTCASFAESPDDETQRQGCQSFLMMARARVMDALTADWDHYDSMEIGVLVNKIVAQLTKQGALKPAEVEEWRKMTEALTRRLPNNPEAIKAHVMTYLNDAGEDPFGPESPLWDWVDRGLELAPTEPQLLEMKLFGEARSEEALSRLSQYAKAHPEQGLPHYHLASYHWRQKDRANTLRELELALQLDPENQRYQETFRKAKNPRTGFDAKIFVVTIGFSWDQF
ncbi:MAG: hypothetical protein KF767_12995 [Bdellovibrionaceae bacterium]|nr:hypothetical protein [Pseudobdellovibrionaceae bacterium]